MSFPTQRQVERPLLQVLAEAGGSMKAPDAAVKLLKYFPQVTPEDLKVTLKYGDQKWKNLVYWARNGLRQKSFLEPKEVAGHGIWKLTAKAYEHLDIAPPDSHMISLPESHRSGKQTHNKLVEHAQHPQESELTLEDMAANSRQSVVERISAQLLGLSPKAFEQFCGELFKILDFEDVEVSGRAGDGGIDGHGGLSMGILRVQAAFQAKRWQNVVGSPEIQRFRGAIHGQFDYGVFITTSWFSRDAKEEALRKHTVPIILIDGERIAELMIEKQIGIRRVPLYTIEVEDEFFSALEH